MNVSRIPDIWLYDVVGSPGSSGDLLFIPARFDFNEGREGRAVYPLSDYHRSLDCDLDSCFEGLDIDAWLGLWVRARIAAVFGVSFLGGWDFPHRRLLDVPLLSVTRTDSTRDLRVTPFVCLDLGTGPALAFSSGHANMDLERHTAYSFWDLLLGNPFELHSFETQIWDEEGGWKQFGYAGQRFFAYDLWDEEASEDTSDPVRGAYPAGEAVPCPDCDGSGEESFFPAGDVCETCQGSGKLA
jgi:hypothetical protein